MPPEYILRQDADTLFRPVPDYSGLGFASHNQARLKYISELTQVLRQSNLVMYPIRIKLILIRDAKPRVVASYKTSLARPSRPRGRRAAMPLNNRLDPTDRAVLVQTLLRGFRPGR